MNRPNPDEEMNYAVIGSDTSSLTEKLEKYRGEISWSHLKPHSDAGALLYVDPTLSLVAVGEALASDDAEQVAAWKKRGDLIVPSEPHAAFWEESSARFSAIVVSPFVLIQPVSAEPSE